ncbi:MAG: hypothetical protein RI531_04615, partial [Haloferacaceae archaeon]|nr:hypothetical protein [Haloferacaceae archaeon]
ALIYFMMGIMVVATNVVPVDQIGIASVFLDTSGDTISANTSVIGGSGSNDGMFNNVIAPVLNSVTGGALIGVWNIVNVIIGFLAWPIRTTLYIGAPNIVVLVSGALSASFAFGLLRIFRDPI